MEPSPEEAAEAKARLEAKRAKQKEYKNRESTKKQRRERYAAKKAVAHA